MISERIRFTMVDLAGSERLTTSSKAQLKESTFINRALSNLSRVIQSLSNLRNKNNNSDETDSSSNNMTKNVDPECRSSALTWALRDELQFKTAVTFLITISPMTVHANESLSSLRFASMLSSIRTVIKVGQQQGGSLSSHELKIASELMARNLDLKRQNTNPNTHVPLMEMSPSRYGNPVALKSASPARNRNNKNKSKYINGKNVAVSDETDTNDSDTLVASPQARRPSASVSHASPATKTTKSSISMKSSVAAVRNPFSASPPRASAAAAPIVTFATDVEKENRSTSVVKITMENATTQYSPEAVRTSTPQDEAQNQKEEKNLHHQMLYEEERLNRNEEELLDEIIEFSPAISNQQNLNTEEQKEEQEQEEDNDSVPVCAMSMMMTMPIGDDNDANEEETSSSPHFNHQFEPSPNRVRTTSTTTTTTSAGSSTIPDLDEIEEQAAAASRALLLCQQNNNDTSDSSSSPSRKHTTSSVASSSLARTDNTFAFITSANLVDVSSIDSIIIDKTDEQQVTSSNRRFANIKNRNHHHQLRIFSASTPILNLGDCDLFVAGTLGSVQSWWATFKKSSTYRQEYIISCVILADDDDETETETLSCFVLSRSSKHLVDDEILSANQEMFSSSPSQSCSPSPARTRSNWNWWGTFWSNEKFTRNGLPSHQQIAKITRARQTQSVFVSEEDQLAFALQHGDSLDLLSLSLSCENNQAHQQQQQSLLQLRFTLVDASRGPVLGLGGQQQHQQLSRENISLSSHLMMESKIRSREEITKEEEDFSDHHQENEKHQQRRSVSFKQEEEITTNCTTSRSVANFVAPHSEKSLFSLTNCEDEKCSQQQKVREAASISSTSSSGGNNKRSSMMSNNYYSYSYSSSVASSAPVTEPSPTNKRNQFEEEGEIPSTSTSINPSAANSKQNSRERDDDDDGNNDNQEPQPINPIHHQQHNSKNENQTTTAATTSFSASASIVAVNSFSSSVLNSASVSRAGTSASPIAVRDENDDEDETDFYYEEVEEIVDVLQDDVNDENIFTVAGESNANKKFVTRTRLVKRPRKEVMITTTSKNKFSISSTRKSLTTNNSATTSADRCGSSISVAISEDGLGQIDENYLHDSDKNNTSGNYGFMMLNNKQKKNGGRRNNNSRGSSTSKSTTSKSLSGNTSTRSSVSPSVSSFSGSLMTTPRGQLPLSARGTKKRFATPLDAIRAIATSSDTQQQQLINQTSMKNSASASSPATFFRKFKARIGSMLNTNSASSQAPKKVSGLEIAQQHQEQEKTEKIISNLKSNNKNKKNLMTFSKSPNRCHHRGVSLSLEREEEILEQGKSSLKNLVDARRSTSRKGRGKSLDNKSSSFHQSSSSSLTMKRHLSHLSP